MEHKIIQRDIDSLIFAEYNPRQLTKDQHQHLKDSIQRFGLVDPILVNKHKDRKDIIIGGHQRVRVAKDLDIDKVPCIELSLPYEKERELNVRLNKNTGEWDMDNLANFFDMEELIDWGFDEDELILPEEEPIAGLTDDDDVPEVEESICKAGDLWLLGDHRLLCGDATKKEDVEVLMDGNKADMVFTDPPYGMNLDTDYSKMGKTTTKYKEVEGDSEKFDASFIFQIASDSYYLWGADYYMDTIPKYKNGNLMVWAKAHKEDENAVFGSSFEICYTYPKCKKEIWFVKRIAQLKEHIKAHPTQKPVELTEIAINKRKPNKVLDLFLGSGSTLIACEKTGRKCYGMEIDPHYCDVIVKRWEQFTGKVAILDGQTEEV
jgi:DNA modification methylase